MWKSYLSITNLKRTTFERGADFRIQWTGFYMREILVVKELKFKIRIYRPYYLFEYCLGNLNLLQGGDICQLMPANQ